MQALANLIAYLRENLKKEENKNRANLEGGSGDSGDSGDYHVRR
jgi:hypothetical protein